MWIDYPDNIVNYDKVNEVYSRQTDIRNMLIPHGLDLQNLNINEAFPSMFYDQIKKLYVDIESNFDKLNDNIYSSAYYIASMTVGDYEPNSEAWYRWIDILNDMRNILYGISRKWQYLVCVNEYPTIDGGKILLRGDYADGI